MARKGRWWWLWLVGGLVLTEAAAEMGDGTDLGMPPMGWILYGVGLFCMVSFALEFIKWFSEPKAKSWGERYPCEICGKKDNSNFIGFSKVDKDGKGDGRMDHVLCVECALRTHPCSERDLDAVSDSDVMLLLTR